ncbi:MAG: hypothetical protein WD278_01270 [Pirellulales bacterium]
MWVRQCKLDAGPERILWGTDSIWNGSPQSQIERLRRLAIKDELVERHGYPQLTAEIKVEDGTDPTTPVGG